MHEKTKNKVAIVGYGNSRTECKYEEDFEIWGMNEIYQIVPKLDVLFDLHDKRHLVESFRNSGHYEWLQRSPIPVYLVKAMEEIQSSVAYPWAEVISEFGTYLTCTVSEMIALALLMKYEEIHLYGIDLKVGKGFGQEYTRQLGSVSYFIGLAVGRGVKVYIPRESSLLKSPLIYGLQGSDEYRATIARLWSEHDKQRQEKEKEINKQEADYWKAVGALEVLEGLQNVEVD